MVMELEETEARNDSAGEDHQQFNRPTELVDSCVGPDVRWQPAGNGVSTEAEDAEHSVACGVCELAMEL
jgi:hypothetical protein